MEAVFMHGREHKPTDLVRAQVGLEKVVWSEYKSEGIKSNEKTLFLWSQRLHCPPSRICKSMRCLVIEKYKLNIRKMKTKHLIGKEIYDTSEYLRMVVQWEKVQATFNHSLNECFQVHAQFLQIIHFGKLSLSILDDSGQEE